MSLSDTSIKNPVFAWMMMLFLIVFGGICFSRLGISQMPDVDFPQVQVGLTLEGASPEIIESDVIDPIEDEIMSVEGIREVKATALQGRGSISIEFNLDKDIDVAVQEIQTKIAQAGNKLPRELDPPIVSKQNADDQTFMWVAVSGHLPIQQLVLYAKDHLKDKLQTVPGVGEVVMGGYIDRNMRIWLKLQELEARELSVDDVIAALGREHVEVPAGRIESGTREMNVRAIGEAPSAEEFRKITVAHRNGAPVFLDEVATIEDGLADKRRIARALGLPAIGMGIKKQFGANTVEVGKGVRAKVAEIQKELPPGVNLEVNSDMTVFIEEAIHEIQFNLVLSVILTSIVCWLFLGSWSSTINILFAIPTSIVGAFIFIYFLGFTLNTFTLLALSLAIGIVVDDAIMVLENIVRHGEMGKRRVRAASEGAREITLAAIAATLAIIAIFLPIAFMKGIIGKFLYQFGVTLSVAVALSLLEALTLTPMRCSQILSVRHGGSGGFAGVLDRFFKRLGRVYRKSLSPCLRWRWLVLPLSLGVFLGSIYLASKIRWEVVPYQDQSMLILRLQTPTGSNLEYTDSRLRFCEELLEEQRVKGPVNRYFAFVGGFGGGNVDEGMVFMTLKPVADRPRSEKTGKPITQAEFQAFLRERLGSIPGTKSLAVNDMSMRGMTGRGGNQFHLQFVVTGPEWERLGEFSDEIARRMKESGIMLDVVTDYQVGMPELRILPDRRRAADLGVSALSIGNTVNALIGGVRAGKFKEGGHRYDVRIRLQSDERSRPDDVKRLMVRNREGKLVRLSEVVQLHEQATVQQITRMNRQRAVTISANVAVGKSQKDANQAVMDIARDILPAGYGLGATGASALFKDAMFDYGIAIGLGIVVAYMVLASQFNSFVHPFLVLLAMPLSVIGAVLGMWWAGISFNMYSMIGMVLLMGIVKKNSILIVEFTNQLRERGRSVKGALLRASPIRLRPILMTSVSTIAAAVPPALALGPGAETVKSMAVVVIGGVALSTILTLYVVPCAYLLLPGRVRSAKEDEELTPERTSPLEASKV
ncbi:MAG TPA: efflux RND transporter permease subunit [Planctomycetota bacterium]